MSRQMRLLLRYAAASTLLWAACFALVVLLGNRSPLVAGALLAMLFGMFVATIRKVRPGSFFLVTISFALVGLLNGLLLELAVSTRLVTDAITGGTFGAGIGLVFGLLCWATSQSLNGKSGRRRDDE